MKTIKYQYPIVAIQWHDAGSAHTEEEAGEIIHNSVGFLIRETEKGAVISMEDDTLSGVHFIPSGMILQIKVLRKSAKK